MQSNLKLADSGILTAEQIGDFHRDGFVVVNDMFGPIEFGEIVEWTSEVQDYPEIPGKYMMYFEDSLLRPGERVLQRVENFAPYHNGFNQLFTSERLFGAVSELFDEPAVLFKEKINFKLPGGDGFKPHQDQQAGWWNYADYFITALISIDEATLENGCLELAAAQHKSGLIGDQWAPLTDEDVAKMGMTPYPTQPGDVVFFDSFAPHGSGPNLSDKPRRVLYITYNRLAAGDHRVKYYDDKRKSFPPDVERDPNREYKFRV